MPETQPTTFGQYLLLEKIAQGGMAEIFKGKALDLHGIEKIVVIKRILPHIAASPEFIEMLVDEAKIAVLLSHGNIAQVYDLGKVADDYFIVMEYVEGKTLSQMMKRLRSLAKLMPIPHAVALCAEIAHGLDYMHRKTDAEGHLLHIVHRDISPQNVILSTSGTVKIIDFGIAKAKTKISTTDSGILKGKFAYMSPEHAEGEKLDHQTDIFSLGVILFELLTGQRLFKGKNNAETIRKVKKTKVPTPSSFRSDIPKSLDEIIFKALKKERSERYSSAHHLAQDLTKFLVTHQPKFSARDLEKYLKEIFPEIINPLPMPMELPVQKGPQEDPEEETAHAATDAIENKLKESEVYYVAAIEPSLSEPSAPLQKEPEEMPSKIAHLPRLLKGIGASVLFGIIIVLFFTFSHKRTEPLPELMTEKIEDPRPAQPLSLPPLPAPVFKPTLPQKNDVTSLKVDSIPPGASLFFNDTDTNKKTPAVLENLAVGQPAKVGVHLEGYQFWEQSVSLTGGSPENLLAHLERNFGRLEVDSLPPEAEVVVDGKSMGKTPWVLEKMDPGSIHEVELKLEGYDNWKGKVKIFGGKTEMIKQALQKAEVLP